MEYQSVVQNPMEEFDDLGELEEKEENVEDLEMGGKIKLSRLFSPSMIRRRSAVYNLHQIARDGHVAELSTLLSSGQWSGRLDELDVKENSALHYAARYSHLDIVNMLLKNSVKIDNIGSDGMTPLHYAARYGKNITCWDEASESDEDIGLEVLKALINAEAEINKEDLYNLTPLHHAAMRGNIKLVQYLSQQDDIDVNCRDKQWSTPLHIAATYGHEEVVRILLEAKANVRLKDHQNQSALHRAAQEGTPEIIKLIFESLDENEREQIVREEDDEGNTPLILSVEAGNSEGVSIFMDNTDCASLLNRANDQGECPLHFASRSGDKVTLELLIDNGAEIDYKNQRNQTPLYLAAENAKENAEKAMFESEDSENVDVVKLLVERGANIDLWDVEGYTPIMIAAIKGHVNVVKYLFESGANLEHKDKNDHIIFHICAQHDRHEIIQALLDDNENAPSLINKNDHYDNTPLHIASREGHVDSVTEILKESYEVDIDKKNEDEQTSCHLSAKYGHTDVLKLLIQKDPNAIFDKDEDDNTPLHLAATNKQFEALEFLVQQGASVQKRNDKSWTALDCAAAAGAYKCAVLLLENDSPVDPRDRKKTTPLHLTAIHGHHKVAQLLLEHGACLTSENDEGKNALELAIHHQNRNVVEIILSSNRWRMAMKSINVLQNERGEDIPNTPIRMLIRTFPDLAEDVFDKCIKQGSSDLEMDYEFLDDTFSLKQKETKSGKTAFYFEDLSDETISPYDGSGTISMENHPLMIMVEEKQKQLLRHPLCLGLLRRKWKRFGRHVFYSQFILYLLFLISITGYILLKLTNKTFPDEENHYLFATECGIPVNTVEYSLRIAVFITVAFMMVIEISQLIRMKSRYFRRFSNLVDWILYGLSIFFVFNACIKYETQGCQGMRCWQWPVGSFLVTASWINFLTYIRQLPFFGIFILMFVDILKTVAKFSVILLVFLVAFGLGFHILFINHLAFDTPTWALVKTYVMMIGEFEFEGIFTEHDDPTKNLTENTELAKNIPFPDYSTVLFVVFVFVMSVIIMNLLVGLAVDDIKEIQEHAELQKISMNVRLVLESERFLPHLKCCLSSNFLREYSKPKQSLTNKAPAFWKMTDVLSKANIWSSMKRRGEARGREGDMDIIREKQNEIGMVVRGLTNQMDALMEEAGELKEMMMKMQGKKKTLASRQQSNF
eukprot:GFUD01026641.1.p1 GENE.GFUD01026641.1~~GFUD01026641.1.p1  ORF type:complete len:1187 (+),score=294.85 GFUD01026641.1:192-3752(+)